MSYLFVMEERWILDLGVSVLLVAALFVVSAAYVVRLTTRGAARSARVAAAGSSFLLGRTPMEMMYWALSPLGHALTRWGVSASSVTLSSLGLGALSGVAIASGHLGVAAGLSTLSALGDALDGMVARESNTASSTGRVLDSAVDRYNDFFFLGGLAVFYRASPSLLVLVLLALAGSFMVSYASAVAEAEQVIPPRGSMRRAERATYLTAGAALVPLFDWAAENGLMEVTADLPLVVAVFLVAVIANVSAMHRLGRIGELAVGRQRQFSAHAESTPRPDSTPPVRRPAQSRPQSLLR